MKAFRPLTLFALFCSLIVMLLSISLFGLIVGFIHQDLMAFGLKFAGQPLGGLRKDEAQQVIENHLQKKFKSPAVILSYGKECWEASPEEVGIAADVAATVQQAFAVGREGARGEQLWDVVLCAIRQREIPLCVIEDPGRLSRWVEQVAAGLHKEPQNASCQLLPDGRIERRPAVFGAVLDPAALAETIRPALLTARLPCHVVLTPEEQAPPIVDGDLAAVDAVLGVYTTYYNPYTNRGANIEIAAASLNHVLIRSGETLSFNSTVGSRVEDAGYLTAPVIISGKVEQDIGGGVCQVSSTLYNAILLANLTPVQRTAHFFPSSYVPAGLDATVADGQIDFSFKNQLPHNVYLLASAQEGELTIQVLGCRADVPFDIHMETAVIGPNPTVEAYRVYEKNGEEVEREFLYTDEYDVFVEEEPPAPAAPSRTEPAAAEVPPPVAAPAADPPPTTTDPPSRRLPAPAAPPAARAPAAPPRR